MVRLLWRQTESLGSQKEVDRWMDVLGAVKNFGQPKNQAHRCQVCPSNRDNHPMRYIRLVCESSTCGGGCTWQAKLHVCSKAPVERENLRDVYAHTFVLGEHNSNQVDPPRLRFTRLMKRSAKEKVIAGMKPNRIRYELFDEFHVNPDMMPPLRTIQAFVANVKISELKETDTVEDLEDFVRRHRFSGLALEDEPFVLPDPWVGDGTTAKPILIGLTNRKLLRTLQLAIEYPLHVDATYKLNKKGLPVIAVGISDAARSYHPIAVFWTSHQTQRHFVNVFRSLQVGYASLGVGALKVKAVMADADKAQYNAVQEVFGRDVQQLMCFYHVIANVKKNAPEKGVPKSRMHDVLSAIYDIHYTFTRAEFESVKTRTLQRWREVPSMHAFTQYFVAEWLGDRFSRWQCFCSSPGFAKTNNPAETFNKTLKRDYTGRALLPVNKLMPALRDMCRHRSQLGNEFRNLPVPPLKLQARTKALMKNGLLVVDRPNRMSIEYTTSATETKVRQLGFALPYDEGSYYANLHEVSGQPQQGWRVSIDSLTCHCDNWKKHLWCVHLVAACLDADVVLPGSTKEKTPIVSLRKRKRGREPAVGHALSLS